MVAESISTAQHLDNTAPKKQSSGSDMVSDLTGPGIEPQTPVFIVTTSKYKLKWTSSLIYKSYQTAQTWH